MEQSDAKPTNTIGNADKIHLVPHNRNWAIAAQLDELLLRKHLEKSWHCEIRNQSVIAEKQLGQLKWPPWSA